MEKEQAQCLFFFAWSERRESNPRESAWEADAIPLGDSRMFMSSRANRDRPSIADAVPFSDSRNRFTDIVYNIFRKKANKKGRLYENFRQIPYHRKKEAFLRRKNPASADLRGGSHILPHARRAARDDHSAARRKSVRGNYFAARASEGAWLCFLLHSHSMVAGGLEVMS